MLSLNTDSANKAMSMLQMFTDKLVVIKDIRELGVTYLGAACELDDTVEVHLDFNQPDNIVEAVFVHEILHIILNHEGFPSVSINYHNLDPEFVPGIEKLASYYSSVIDHPQVYRRMKSLFKIDLDSYYETQMHVKVRRFLKGYGQSSVKDRNYYFIRQQDILLGLDYWCFGRSQKDKLLDIFEKQDKEAYQSCLELRKEIVKTGFDNPESAMKSAQVIKQHIVRYGEKHGIGTLNEMWRALVVSSDN